MHTESCGWSVPLLLAAAVVSSSLRQPVHAAITASGNVTPAYDGVSDPWVVGSPLTVGQDGAAVLRIDGGSVVATERAEVGASFRGGGLLTVTGDGSLLDVSGHFRVSGSEIASVVVEDGGRIKSGALGGATEVFAADMAVTGRGSEWLTPNSFHVRGGGVRPTNLRVDEGGYLQTGDAVLDARRLGFVFDVKGSGAGSEWNVQGDLTFRGNGSEILNVSDRGSLVVDGAVEFQATPQVDAPDNRLAIADRSSAHLRGNLLIAKPSQSAVTLDSTSSLIVEGATLMGLGPEAISGTDGGANGAIELNPGAVFRTRGLVGDLNDLFGSGVVETTGLATDRDLEFSTPSDLKKSFVLDEGMPSERIVHLDATDPETAGPMGAGFRGEARMSVASGMRLVSRGGYFGQHEGAFGEALIAGLGTQWHSRGDVILGQFGRARLVVEDGAQLDIEGDLNVGVDGEAEFLIGGSSTASVSGVTYLGREHPGEGSLRLAEGSLETGGLFADLNAINGVGQISTRGIVADVDLVLDSPADLRRQFEVSNRPGDLIRLDVDPTSGQAPVLGAGYAGEGTLEISNGVTIDSISGTLAFREGSRATARVSGEGSAWHVQDQLAVGDRGSGSLTIDRGATVTAGHLTVTGPDSLLHVSGEGASAIVEGRLAVWDFTAAINATAAPVGGRCESKAVLC